MKKFYEELAPLLTGFTVMKVEPGVGREGDPTKITCRKGDIIRNFEIWGGIYGPSVSHLKESISGNPESWADVDMMFKDIDDHVVYSGFSVTIEAADDHLRRRFGFRCSETGTEWWTTIQAVKGSKVASRFSSPESREEVARRLTDLLPILP